MAAAGRRVVVVADWDADGVVAAALVRYAQETLGLFPLEGARARVEALPAGPRSLESELPQAPCGEALVVLDIPATEPVVEALRGYLARCRPRLAYYFDHHDATMRAMQALEEAGFRVVVGRSATSVLVRMFLEGLGARLTPRLKTFTDAVAVLEGRRRAGLKAVSDEVVRMAASISKALNVSKSREQWLSYVAWLSNPLPFEPPKLPGPARAPGNPLQQGLKAAEETDAQVREKALELAMQAVRAGYLKFVDARGKWRARGASALAGEISRITGQPVALLVERNDGALLLVIRGPRGFPQALAQLLLEQGIAEDRGGHENLATARLRPGISRQELLQALQRLSLEAWRRARPNTP